MMEKSGKSSGWFGRILGIVLVLVALVGGYLNYQKQCSCTSVTSGTIVEVKQKMETKRVNGKRERGMVYSPVYEYKAGDKVIRKAVGSSTKREAFVIGNKVVICYNPSRPESFYVKGKEKWYYVACGLVALLGMGVLYLESRKRGAK